MSIPLVQEATKDAINTSIIAIKRNIERINMLLGLSNSEEIDTSKFATKEELQQAVTDLQPVDEVALNNMHSVTSNAVAKALNNVSELKTLRDDGAGVIKYRTLGKIIIFSIHSKYTGIMSVSLSDANITCASFSEGMKTSLCWGGSCVGEAYISQDGTGIIANMPSSANGSGQIIAFLA